MEYSGGTQKSNGQYGVGNSDKWEARDEETRSAEQAAYRLPRWDNSEKATSTTQNDKYARDLRRTLRFDLTKEKNKLWADESSKMGQLKKQQGDEPEITSPI